MGFGMGIPKKKRILSKTVAHVYTICNFLLWPEYISEYGLFITFFFFLIIGFWFTTHIREKNIQRLGYWTEKQYNFCRVFYIHEIINRI